jgi:hypothetical protein
MLTEVLVKCLNDPSYAVRCSPRLGRICLCGHLVSVRVSFHIQTLKAAKR